MTRMRPDTAQPPVPYFGRSIGENTGTVYGTGTVTLDQGSRTAIFSGATLPNNIGEGDVLTIGGSTTYYIASRESATEVIVRKPMWAAVIIPALLIRLPGHIAAPAIRRLQTGRMVGMEILWPTIPFKGEFATTIAMASLILAVG